MCHNVLSKFSVLYLTTCIVILGISVANGYGLDMPAIVTNVFLTLNATFPCNKQQHCMGKLRLVGVLTIF